jgi:hypothetical protein
MRTVNLTYGCWDERDYEHICETAEVTVIEVSTSGPRFIVLDGNIAGLIAGAWMSVWPCVVRWTAWCGFHLRLMRIF